MNFHQLDLVELDPIARSVLGMLWRSSWQAGVLAGVVLAIQFALGKRLAPRWRHAMWWVVLLRLMIPVTPPSPLSLFNVAPEPPAAVDRGIVLIMHTLPPSPLAASRAADPHWSLILTGIWLMGMMWMLSRIIVASVILSIAVRRMTRVRDPHILALLDGCRAELHVRRELEIRSSPTIGAPALMGFLRPRLLLPPTVLENFDAGELRLILLHELAHLKRHDVAINWLISILQAIHWFNPIVWLAFARLRSDRELAADELVLSLTGDEQRVHYGDTLVKLLQTLSRRPALAGTVGILERAHPMRRRITMIAQFHRRAPRWAIAAASCLIVLAALGLTDRVRGEPPASGATGAATTKPAATNDQADAVLRDVMAQLVEAGYPPTTQAVEDARKKLAEGIRAKMLIVARDGKPVNQKVVDAAIVRELAQLDAMLADAKSASGSPPASPADDKATASLQKRLPEVNFSAIGFSDVTEFLRDVTGENLTVNWRVLEAAGVDRNVPITARLKDITLEQALTHVLKDAGGGSVKLGFGVSNGSIVISTLDDLAQQAPIRAYDVADLLQPQDKGSAQALVHVVEKNVDGVTVTSYHDRLLVKGAPAQLREVERVLEELRRKPAQAAK